MKLHIPVPNSRQIQQAAKTLGVEALTLLDYAALTATLLCRQIKTDIELQKWVSSQMGVKAVTDDDIECFAIGIAKKAISEYKAIGGGYSDKSLFPSSQAQQIH